MTCATCGGSINGDKLTVYYAHYNGYLISIKNVPGAVCPQCGEVWYKSPVLKRVKALIEEAKKTIDSNIVMDYAA